jgi:hypothetical protein
MPQIPDWQMSLPPMVKMLHLAFGTVNRFSNGKKDWFPSIRNRGNNQK